MANWNQQEDKDPKGQQETTKSVQPATKMTANLQWKKQLPYILVFGPAKLTLSGKFLNNVKIWEPLFCSTVTALQSQSPALKIKELKFLQKKLKLTK